MDQLGEITMTKMLSPKRAAEYMDVSEDTVLRLLKSGELKGNTMGRQWRTTEDDILFYYNRPKEEKVVMRQTRTRRTNVTDRIICEPIGYVNGRPNYV